MAKFGKRNVVSTDLSKYNICLLGESGIGKTTTMKNVCENLFGEDGYMIFNCGKEDGVDCLANASYENIDTYAKFDEVTMDIIKNKETDYPNLKVIVYDTLDQLIEITEPAVVNAWNRQNIGRKDFVKATTLNGSWGGFGRGEDRVLEVLLGRIWELKKVGVAFWSCGHVKTREILDPISGNTYTSLSTNMMTKYFNGFKTKMHVVGVACIDREIVKESTGRKNIVTKKDITKNQIVSESRKIVFRDDNYSIDSKSRFANIVNEIPLDADAFIKALQDAINEAATGNVYKKQSAPTQPVEEPTNSDPVEVSEESVEAPADPSSDAPQLVEEARAKFKTADTATKKEVKKLLNGGKLSEDMDYDLLTQIHDLLTKGATDEDI